MFRLFLLGYCGGGFENANDLDDMDRLLGPPAGKWQAECFPVVPNLEASPEFGREIPMKLISVNFLIPDDIKTVRPNVAEFSKNLFLVVASRDGARGYCEFFESSPEMPCLIWATTSVMSP